MKQTKPVHPDVFWMDRFYQATESPSVQSLDYEGMGISTSNSTAYC